MPADRLPESPDLDQLKRQAKELLKAWSTAPSAGIAQPRLRDAQRAIAERYGFASWDALRDAVHPPAARRRHRGIDYDNHVPDTVAIGGSLTQNRARQLADQGVTGVKVGVNTSPGALRYLATIPRLERLDLSDLQALSDDQLDFLQELPRLTAVAFARFGRTGDRAVALLAGKPKLSRVALGPGLTDAGVERLRDFPALATMVNRDSILSISASRTLTDRALGAVGKLQGVAALDVHMSVFGSPFYTAAGAAHLKKMGALEALNFHGRLVTDDILREIAAIPQLRWLHAQDITSGDDGFAALGRCVTLETLAARFCHAVTDRGVAALAGLPGLASLNIGGRRLTDAAFAPFGGSTTLVDLSPPLSRDEAFAHIARIPNLERLTNMYNRSTTDAATRHLEGHERLEWYGVYGTQITDESLDVLSRLQSLEHVELDNLFGITDEGVRVLAGAARLRRLSVDTCARVSGRWQASAPKQLDTSFNRGDREYAEFYRAETLMDYPDLPMPGEVPRPAGAPAPAIAPALACIAPGPAFEGDVLGVRVSGRPQRAGVITRDPFSAPMRIDLVVRPLEELRIVLGAHNRMLAFNHQGDVIDPAPWFLKLEADKGQRHGAGSPLSARDWTRVTIEIDATEQRLFVDGRLRHSWKGQFAALRTRVALGATMAGITIRSLSLEPLSGERLADRQTVR